MDTKRLQDLLAQIVTLAKEGGDIVLSPAKNEGEPKPGTPEGTLVPHVYASVWGDRGDEQTGNWEQLYYPQFKPKPGNGKTEAWISLPAVVPAGTKVYLQHCTQEGSPQGPWVGPFDVVDLGPWYDGTDGKSRREDWFDPYWRTGTRPKVETSLKDPRGRVDNGCGIDLTPKAFALATGKDPQEVWERPGKAYVNVVIWEPNKETAPVRDMITPNFSWQEFEQSETAKREGIDNRIPDSVKPAITALCENLLEPVRKWAQGPVKISSGYRCDALDKAVHKGNGTTQSRDKDHTHGFGCDIVKAGELELRHVFAYIRDNLEFDRLIWEDSHIHVSYKAKGNRNLVVRSP